MYTPRRFGFVISETSGTSTNYVLKTIRLVTVFYVTKEHFFVCLFCLTIVRYLVMLKRLRCLQFGALSRVPTTPTYVATIYNTWFHLSMHRSGLREPSEPIQFAASLA